MKLIKEAVTGKEIRKSSGTAYDALVDFYYAFNHGDLQAMADNWLQTDESVMDNPLGGIKRGWWDIQQVYAKIFQGQAKVYVEFYDYSLHEQQEVFFAVGKERGYFQTALERIELNIRTSRIFRRVDNRWKQVHHHGSIESPVLLNHYQTAVLGKANELERGVQSMTDIVKS